jgi:hypothetical protein
MELLKVYQLKILLEQQQLLMEHLHQLLQTVKLLMALRYQQATESF